MPKNSRREIRKPKQAKITTAPRQPGYRSKRLRKPSDAAPPGDDATQAHAMPVTQARRPTTPEDAA
jgi:hypothetical protein